MLALETTVHNQLNFLRQINLLESNKILKTLKMDMLLSRGEKLKPKVTLALWLVKNGGGVSNISVIMISMVFMSLINLDKDIRTDLNINIVTSVIVNLQWREILVYYYFK